MHGKGEGVMVLVDVANAVVIGADDVDAIGFR